MIKRTNKWKVLLIAAMMLVTLCGMQVSVQAASGDNSLSTLGILTEGAEVSPEFYYSTIEYNVTVPAGTTQLELDPVPSNANASIIEITGKELVDGETTVEILVEAENGNRYTYYLYVEAEEGPAVVETEPQTESETEPETEPETEDPRYVRVDRNSLQEAENTIQALKAETGNYRDRLDILMKILYGLIGFCVILLFVVINLTLKKKDLKAELQKYMGYGYPQGNGDPMQDMNAPYQNGYGYDNSNYMYDGQNADQMMGYDGYDAQGYPQQEAYDEQDYSQQEAYAEQGYPQQEVYAEQEYPQQNVYEEQQYEEEPVQDQKAAKKEKKKRRGNDDPDTVPKPSKARKAEKPQPKYQKPARQAEYQPNEKASENVEINMIDL